MRLSKWFLSLMLCAGTALAQEPAEPSASEGKEKKEKEVKVEKVVTSTISIVTVDDEGNVVTKTITSDDDGHVVMKDGDNKVVAKSIAIAGAKVGKDGEVAKSINVEQKDGVIQITLPDGSTKTINLGKIMKDGAEEVLQIKELPLNVTPSVDGAIEIEAEAIGEMKGLAEALKSNLKIFSEVEGLEGLSEEMAEKLSKAIEINFDEGDGDGPHIARFGKIVVLGDRVEDGGQGFRFEMKVDGEGEAEASSDGEVKKKKKVVMQKLQQAEGAQSSSEAKILEKLDAIMQRLDKIESEVEAMKKKERADL